MKDFTTSRHTGKPNKGVIQMSAPPKLDKTIHFGPVSLRKEGVSDTKKSKGRMDNHCPTIR